MEIKRNKCKGFLPWVGGIYSIIQALLLSGCAAYSGAPVGGPQDVLPPSLALSIPPMGSTFFHAKAIQLQFNEFIELKDIDKIYSSPRLDKLYYNTNLKQLKVDIQDTLEKDKTYTIRFGNSVVDLHESNPLIDFSYVFSTGKSVDSMFLEGHIYQALDLKGVDGAHLLFYAAQPDSFPLRQKPDYISSSNKEGYFNCIHMKEGCYYIYATTDENKDFQINPVEEQMAFSDTCYTAWRMVNKITTDSLTPLEKKEDTNQYTFPSVHLYLYKDFLPEFFLKDVKFQKRGQLSLSFLYPVDRIEDLDIQLPVDSFFTDIPYRKEFMWADDHKSVEVYLQKYDITEGTLILKVNGFVDTTDFVLPEFAAKRNDTLKFKLLSNAQSPFYVYDTLKIVSNIPLRGRPYLEGMELWHMVPITPKNDSAPTLDTIRQDFRVSNLTSWGFQVLSQWKEGESYVLFMRDSTVFDFWGQTEDTLTFRFTCGLLEERGELSVNLQGLEPHQIYRLWVLDQNNKKVRELRVVDTGKVEIPYLLPGQYTLLLFKDDNDNGQWDEGRYIYKRQAEKRWFSTKKLKVEADWRIEENWSIK